MAGATTAMTFAPMAMVKLMVMVQAMMVVEMMLVTVSVSATSSPLLASPPHVYPDSDGVTNLTLTVDVARIDLPGAGQLTTRVYHYEGQPVYPGPTIHLARGGKLNLTLVNNLGPDPVDDGGHNDWKSVNTTNIHTHGFVDFFSYIF